MKSSEEPLITQPVLRGITPRRPLRQSMSDLQSLEECDEAKEEEKSKAKEGEKSNESWLSVWESVASWSRYYLHIPYNVKIPYYLTVLLTLSTIKNYVDVSHLDDLTGKHSVLNQMFAKKSWGITLAVFISYRIVSLFLQPKMMVNLAQLIIRSAATTLIYLFTCKVIFDTVDNLSSSCIAGNETLTLTKAECLSYEGRQYVSFDISGHSYLLTYCVLIMMEESKEILYFLWLRRRLFGEAARDKVEDSKWPDLDEKQVKSLRTRLPKLSPFVAVTFFNMCAVVLLWDFIILVTTLYYHTFAEKMIGTFFAFFMWYILYKAAFPWLFTVILRS